MRECDWRSELRHYKVERRHCLRTVAGSAAAEEACRARTGSARRTAGRYFIVHAVGQTIDVLTLLGESSQRRAGHRNAASNGCAGPGQIDESSVVRVGVQVIAIGEVIEVGTQPQSIALAKLDFIGDAHIPSKEVGLAGWITREQEGPAALSHRRPIVIRKLVYGAIAVYV